MSETMIATKRRGCITVDVAVYSDLGDPTTNEAWHTALLLPERYEVERWERKLGKYGRDVFEIWVLSDDIPEVDAHISRIEVNLTMQSTPNEDYTARTVSIMRLDFSYWDGEQWHTITGKEEENPRLRVFAIKPYVPPIAQEDTVKVYPQHAIPDHAVTLELHTDTPYEICSHFISAKRALSLLDQLDKERPTLEQMAQETAQ